MYVAVKGGEAAILNSYRLLAEQRRGDAALPELSVAQIRQQLKLAVDRVMTEGSVYDPELAALAIKQAAGDLVEAIFLLRAYRATLPRLGTTCPLDTSRMALDRRISATFKDLPGGQVLGPTYDYTQRLLDFKLLAEGPLAPPAAAAATAAAVPPSPTPRVVDLLNQEGLIETRPVPPGDPAPTDLTREPLRFPANRATRLQNLARGDEGFLLAMAYSTQRGYSHSHPFVGEVRLGTVAVEIVPEELGFPRRVGRAVGSFITGGGVGDFDGQMHSDDVVWRDKTTGKSFAAPRETLGGMTTEGFRRRYNEPSDYLRRMNVTQN